MFKIADEKMGIGAVCGCCCLILLIVFVFGGASSDNPSSTNDIITNDMDSEEETLPILNMTNTTINTTKTTFVYYDHNTTTWNGCYGLNYTVLTDKWGNNYMLDHATTDILGEKTNYTFKYPNGIGLVFDNNTETEIYNNTKLYYVHEVSDDNDTVIKSLGNFTLNDKSHEPEFIPSDWLFVYHDHNSTEYEGDQDLWYAQTNNTVGKKEQNVHIYDEEYVIGLAYFANKDFDFYKYGINGLNLVYQERDNDNESYYYVANSGLHLPNGTKIKTFGIEDYDLDKSQKDFITDYYNRIEDVRHKQEIDAIYEAEDDASNSYARYHESQNKKPKYSTYYGTNGYGIIRY